MRLTLIAAAFATTITTGLASNAVAQTYVAENRLKVVALNASDFEVIEVEGQSIPTSVEIRAAGWAEAAVLQAALAGVAELDYRLQLVAIPPLFFLQRLFIQPQLR